MPGSCRIGIVSDIHYAAEAERARGNDYEIRTVANPFLRLLLRIHRRFVWLKEPLAQNHLLDPFLNNGSRFDYVIANGDYSCNTAFIGLSDGAALDSAKECVGKIRSKFAERARFTVGDHELGKKSFVGGLGGMRLASWQATRQELGLPGLWKMELGRYTLLGVVSTLVALPVYAADALPEELPEWEKLRAAQLSEVKDVFRGLSPNQKVLLFCHDPTALPFLLEQDEVRARVDQIEQTIIGHLHSNLILRLSRIAAGMPRLTLLGHTARRMSTALRQARHWQQFKVRLCPSLAGIELLKDGGYLTVELDLEGAAPACFDFHPVPRHGGR